jgi:tRNA (guanosine-2'-O-)-methyltransferase
MPSFSQPEPDMEASGFGTPWAGPWKARAIIERLEPLVLERRRARLMQVLENRLGSVTLLLDELSDPHNRAAIVRSCDAFGVQLLHSLQPRPEFAIHHGVAAGTERWVDVCPHAGPQVAVAHLVQRGFELIQTHPNGELEPSDLAALPKVALILGNEHRGIDPVFASAATRSVRIPMRGFVESLNVSVSAAVLLAAATHGRKGDLPEAVKQHLYARALFFTVPRAAHVLDAFLTRAQAVPGGSRL